MNPSVFVLTTVVEIFLAVAICDVTLQFFMRKWMGSRNLNLESIVLFSFLGLGAVLIFQKLHVRFQAEQEPLAGFLILAAYCLYITAVLNFFQCKSIFSRGYSIRVLVDLLEGGPATINNLMANYGGGKGMTGMLEKRLQSMVSVGLIQFDGKNVGPLTGLGRIMAVFGQAYRKLLRLDEVG